MPTIYSLPFQKVENAANNRLATHSVIKVWHSSTTFTVCHRKWALLSGMISGPPACENEMLLSNLMSNSVFWMMLLTLTSNLTSSKWCLSLLQMDKPVPKLNDFLKTKLLGPPVYYQCSLAKLECPPVDGANNNHMVASAMLKPLWTV